MFSATGLNWGLSGKRIVPGPMRRGHHYEDSAMQVVLSGDGDLPSLAENYEDQLEWLRVESRVKGAI